MASVSGSDSSTSRNQDEVLRKKREEYQQKESELVKKHRNEVQRINQQHYQELENVKKNHENQMQDLRSQSRNNQAKRDHTYQKQMNSLREMHRKQVTDLSKSGQDKIEKLRAARDQEVVQLKGKHANQVEQIQDQNKKNFQVAESRFQKTMDAQREAQKKAVSEQRDKLVSRSLQERAALTDSHSKSHSSLQKSYSDYREHTTSQMRDQKVRSIADKKRSEENMISQLRRERSAHNDSVELMKEGFSESLAQQRDRFHRAQQKRQEAQELSRDQLKSSVSERVNSQVRRLEQDKVSLQNEKVLDSVRNKKRTSLQIKNLTRDYQSKLENMQEQKNEAVRQANMSNRDDVLKVHEDSQKHMKAQSRYYLDQRHLENSKNRQAINSLETDFASRIKQSNQNADQRVEKVLAMETDKTQRLQEKYEEARAMLKDTHHKDILELRESYMKDRDMAINNLKEQMQKREIEHAAKMNQLQNEHKKKMTSLNDELMRTKQSGDMRNKLLVKDMKRSQETQLEGQKMRYEQQLAEAREAHAREISALNKRHEEQLDQVLNTIRKT